MKNFNNDYYTGFDIGTDSVGYAVADTDYNLCKFKGNAMWGVDLFEESNSAAERRTLRSARRRGLRKRNRIEWLQMIVLGVHSVSSFFSEIKRKLSVS